MYINIQKSWFKLGPRCFCKWSGVFIKPKKWAYLERLFSCIRGSNCNSLICPLECLCVLILRNYACFRHSAHHQTPFFVIKSSVIYWTIMTRLCNSTYSEAKSTLDAFWKLFALKFGFSLGVRQFVPLTLDSFAANCAFKFLSLWCFDAELSCRFIVFKMPSDFAHSDVFLEQISCLPHQFRMVNRNQ